MQHLIVAFQLHFIALKMNIGLVQKHKRTILFDNPFFVTLMIRSVNLSPGADMKQFQILLAGTLLILLSLACNALARGGSNSGGIQPTIQPTTQTTETPANSDGNGTGNQTVSTDFVLTSDATHIMDMGNGSILFYTKLSLVDIMKFYRDTYTAQGYKEREQLTVTSDTTLSMVFDGDPSGKSIVIQSVDLGNGSHTVTVRLEVVN
jgi:hypothetical protein